MNALTRPVPSPSARRVVAGLAAAALTAAVAVLAMPAAPASAAAVAVSDDDDTTHGSDLLRMRVRHGEDQVQIRTTHADLQRDPASGSGGQVYIDTDSADQGPELVFVGGYFEGTDYQLLHTEGFGAKQWGNPVEGSWRMSIDYDAETVSMAIDRDALSNPEDIRVAARVSGPKESTVDWYGKTYQFTKWVTAG